MKDDNFAEELKKLCVNKYDTFSKKESKKKKKE